MRTLLLVLLLLGLGACSRNFWYRPRVAGSLQRSPTATQTYVPPTSPAVATSGGAAPDEQAVLAAVNCVRRSRGLRPLVFDPALYGVARAHSEEQSRLGYMGHASPDPRRRTLPQRMQLGGYEGRIFGEVVAWGYPTSDAVVQGWMNSPDHRAILLDRELQEAAFSHVGSYWTGNFGTPMGRATAPAPMRAPARAPSPAPTPTVRRYFAPPQPPTPRPTPTRAAAQGG